LLQGLHVMIAMRLDQPHWMLNDPDAKAYGQALSNALRHIPIKVAQKSIDFFMLAVAIGQFEVPRMYLSAQIARARATQGRRGGPPGPGGATVFQFKPPPQGSPSPPPSGGGAPGNGAANGAANGSAPAADMTYEPEPDTPRFGP
jgi:hypothetical protein